MVSIAVSCLVFNNIINYKMFIIVYYCKLQQINCMFIIYIFIIIELLELFLSEFLKTLLFLYRN